MESFSINELCQGYGDSRIGGRSENQDSFGRMETNRGFLILVCDGMGGGPGGKTASSIAVREIMNGVEEADASETSRNVLIKAIACANMAIYKHGLDVPQLRGMGSTVVAVLIDKNVATIAHVGDSRAYQVRGNAKIFRTFDHSMVFEMVKQKVITEEQARLSAQSNIITRALGIKSDVEVEIDERPYEKGDRFLLCTDGVHGAMPEQKLIKLISGAKPALGITVENLITKVDSIGREQGGHHDNLTAVLLEMSTNSTIKEKMSKRIKNWLLCLSAVLLISLVFNIAMVSRKSPVSKVQNVSAQLKDSVKMLQLQNVKKLEQMNGKLIQLNKEFEKVKKESKEKDSYKKTVDDVKAIIKYGTDNRLSRDTLINKLKVALANSKTGK